MDCLCYAEDFDQVIYRLEFDRRPWTTNAERAGNRWERAKLTKEWRDAFAWLARSQNIPNMRWISVVAQPHQKNGRLQDVGACNPAVKAAIDGLVDAGIIADDSSEFVRSLIFMPPQKEKNSLVLYIRGVER